MDKYFRTCVPPRSRPQLGDRENAEAAARADDQGTRVQARMCAARVFSK